MEKNAKIYIAGHRAILRHLQAQGFDNFVLRTSKELDLRSQQAVADFFAKEKPEYVFLSAARVGGILANKLHKGTFIYDNLMIQSHVLHEAYKNDVKKLLFLGSSCIYPKLAAQPIKEEYLLTGHLEETNDAYAVAKIAGIQMCKAYREQYGVNFISAMPTNLYGEGDNYDLNASHVLPALLRKFVEAKQNNSPTVEIWGTGTPKREFLNVDDLAEACIFLMQHYNDPEIVNVGTGEDISIKDLAILIKEMVAFEGDLHFDTTKPDGTPRKLLDVSKINALGWKYNISLREGIRQILQTHFQLEPVC
ncbi:MAG: GDP-L-fucose synthase [Cytophagales bacterium]|nr:MAG: GDP-L-fucose synthase [Cytophagales bacterium]